MEPQSLEAGAPAPLRRLTSSTRERVMAGLLADSAAERRGAFVEAIARGWLDRGPRTVVTAVLLGPSSSTASRVAFGQHVAAGVPARATFLREEDGIAYLITRGLPVSGPEEWIAREAQRLGVPVLGIGTAPLDASASDLGDAAEQSRTAAELSAALPEFDGAAASTALGGWALVHSVALGPQRLADISPAAAELRRGDRIQRETIEVYLDEGGQVRAACSRLHIHRTTLYYRLENMPEAVRAALDDGWQRSTLHLALKLLRLWESTGVIDA
ncbi:helix-turn-helix domain-containing protein [Microbacteriaceae bacterium VKM Ac-2854]|nr:helix-turn-helix domain-containing protein [Microbacteriaceae bacterium VKM Ac-2854]